MMADMLLGSMLMYVEAWRLATIENAFIANTSADFTKYWTASTRSCAMKSISS